MKPQRCKRSPIAVIRRLERCTNYFPDKESVAATLRQQYYEDLQSRVKSLMVESNNLSSVRFAESFIDCITDFVEDRPAWLNLVAAPISLHRASPLGTLCARPLPMHFEARTRSFLENGPYSPPTLRFRS